MEPAPPLPESAPAPPTRSRWWDRLFLLAQRWVLIIAGAQIAQRLPLPLLEDWLPVKHVLIAVATVILMGKALFDTLFYDRYLP